MSYQYLLFDLDGTLTDPKEGITKCVQYALEKFGIIEPELDNLLCFIGPPLMDSFQEYYGMSKEDAKKATEKYRERFSVVGLYENGVFDGVADMLAELKEQGKIIALATSKPWVFAEKILEKYELKPYFDIICGSELDGTRSAKAEVIQEVLRQLELSEENLEQVVMIGDRKHDIIGAKACRLASIGVRFGYAESGELEEAGADYIAGTVLELRKYLL